MTGPSCGHWRDGACGLGRYGGRPSLGVCLRVCDLGRAGNSDSTPAPAVDVEGRLEACRGCDAARHRGAVLVCTAGRCRVRQRWSLEDLAAIPGHRCPLDRWPR